MNKNKDMRKDNEKVSKPDPPKQKRPFLITVEGVAPVKIQLETWAYNEEEAMEQLNNQQLVRIRERPEVDVPRIIRKKVTVKDMLTSLVKLVKNF